MYLLNTYVSIDSWTFYALGNNVTTSSQTSCTCSLRVVSAMALWLSLIFESVCYFYFRYLFHLMVFLFFGTSQLLIYCTFSYYQTVTEYCFFFYYCLFRVEALCQILIRLIFFLCSFFAYLFHSDSFYHCSYSKGLQKVYGKHVLWKKSILEFHKMLHQN